MFRGPDGHLTHRTVRALSALHAAVFRLTGGRLGRRLVDNDMLLLTTVGRRSGSRHRVPLLFVADGDTIVVVASYGGRDHHPDWYLNLLAHPIAEIQVRGETRRVSAVTAGTDRRAALWPQVVAAYEGYRDYQGRTRREIPLVLLEPLPAN